MQTRHIDSRVRNPHGVAAAPRLTHHAFGVAIHVPDIDLDGGRAWSELAAETSDSLSIVLAQVGGRVEGRLARDVTRPDGRLAMVS